MADQHVSFENVPDLLDINQAAGATRTSEWIIRQAIRRYRESEGKDPKGLPAFIPGGRDRQSPGRGQGYRIHKADLHRWYFGEEST